MDTPTHVVLLNNLREGADLGPVKPIRRRHLEPEADIRVVPRHMVEGIERLKPSP